MSTSTKIKEKIAVLEVLEDAIHNAEMNMRCYMGTDENGNECLPSEDYALMRVKAWQKVIDTLEKMV